MAPGIVYLDGPPGAGKSTILSNLAAKYKLTVIPEPLMHWSAALRDLDRLQSVINVAMSTDEPADILSELAQYELVLIHLQTLVLSWYQQLAAKIPEMKIRGRVNVVVVERSPVSALVFHRLAANDENRTRECVAQLDAIAKQYPEMPAAAHFDLRASPEQICERLRFRNAPGDGLWTPEGVQLYYEMFDVVMAEKNMNPSHIDASDSPEAVADAIYSRITHSHGRSRTLREMFF